jgi:lambda repressor-like predicted transcriptional regulator
MIYENQLTDPLEIKIALLRAGKSQAKIARRLGVSKAQVTMVIKGKRAQKRVRRAIAKAVGRRVNELWPSGPFKKAA